MANTTTTPVQASAKEVRISPRKVGEVVALVRGRTIAEALVVLDHTPRRAAQAVSKLVRSAEANATRNHNFKADGLYIEEIFVTIGSRIKRFRPASRGRALPYEKKTSHIFIKVNGVQRAAKPAAKKLDSKEKK